MERVIPNKGDVHYVIFTSNNEILKLNTLNSFFRQDIKLVIKRTFIKTSGGKREYDYFKNQILDKDLKLKRNNSFDWNGIKCQIIGDEIWSDIVIGLTSQSVILSLKITDRLKRENIIRYNMAKTYVFEQIKNDLVIIDRVGTHQALIEIKKLNDEIIKLKSKNSTP